MKIERLNSWVTLGANLGILVGLLFLVYEIRQNTLQLRSQASYSINQGISILNAGIYNDSVLARIVIKGEKDFHSLDSVEMVQFTAYQFDRINMAIHIKTLEKDGIANVHFPYVEFLRGQYHLKPGLQSFLVSVEDVWAGSKELYDELRK